MDCIEVFRQAEKEIAESGKLSLTARRKIWQTMGEIEPRDRDSIKPRSLTEPLKKRAYLALACAKKVMPMWCSVDPDDKSPQNLIKKSLAYLDGKIRGTRLGRCRRLGCDGRSFGGRVIFRAVGQRLD